MSGNTICEVEFRVLNFELFSAAPAIFNLLSRLSQNIPTDFLLTH